jgi:hypothetical protein
MRAGAARALLVVIGLIAIAGIRLSESAGDTAAALGPGRTTTAAAAFCLRYPRTWAVLTRRLAAAKAARARAATRAERVGAARRLVAATAARRALAARLSTSCPSAARRCAANAREVASLDGRLARARAARARAVTPAARAAGARAIASLRLLERRATGRTAVVCRVMPPVVREDVPPVPDPPADTTPPPTDTSVTPPPEPPVVPPVVVTEITTGEILGPPFDRRSFYVRYSGGPWGLTYPTGPAAARGRLMSFRAANAIFDDEARADDDPAANTAAFISHFAEYRARGILAYTVSLQGGAPGYDGAIASAFAPDGSLKQPWLDRAAGVIEAAGAHGQTVILTYFYQGQDQVLADDDAVRAAVRNATDWLIAKGYRNVIIEIANEHDSATYKHPVIGQNLATGGVAELIALAKSRFAGRGYRLPVSASVRDLDFSGPLRAASDLALIHGNLTTPAQDAAAVAKLVADPTVHGPVVMNEDFNGFTATPENLAADELTASGVLAAGGSWGPMWQRYTQDYPFRWALGPSGDISGGSQANYFRALLDHVASLTGAVP